MSVGVLVVTHGPIGGVLLRHVPGLAHAEHCHPPGAAGQHPAAGGEAVVQALGQGGDRVGFGAQHLARGIEQFGGAGRGWRAELRRTEGYVPRPCAAASLGV